MKILKPGKVEMRKFECPECGCVFVAEKSEAVKLVGQDGNTTISLPYYVECPCSEVISWDDGTPYEEPAQDEGTDVDRLKALLLRSIERPRNVTVQGVAEFLADNGVTFRKEEK